MKEQTDSEKIASLRNRLKRKKYISILLALFTLGVNIFAWFAFSNNASLTLEGTVAAWDVEFKDPDTHTTYQNTTIALTKMKPGMTDVSKTIVVENHSDVNVNFQVTIEEFSILGQSIDFTNIADPMDYINTEFPFSVEVTTSSPTLGPNSSVDVVTTVSWPFETANRYFAQTDLYNYDAGFIYYKKNGTDYNVFPVPNAATYATEKDDLYLEKDDADSYFGMQCHTYEDDSGEPCLYVVIRLIASQI